jgi:hypothetical protein
MTNQTKICDYKIVCYSNVSFIEQTVCEELQDGWQPFGGPIWFTNENSKTAFAHAMVRYCDSRD